MEDFITEKIKEGYKDFRIQTLVNEDKTIVTVDTVKNGEWRYYSFVIDNE